MSSHEHDSHGGHADAWHHHSGAEGVPQHEHAAIIDTTSTFKILLLVFGFTAVFILITILYFNVTVRREQEAKVETTGGAKIYNEMRSLMENDLATYAVVDPATKTVRIPVERAMDRVVKQYSAKK
jgi:hypothetical protein